MTMPRIAVIDDDPALLRLVSEPLTQRGWDVLACGEGRDPFPLVRDEQPDLINSDPYGAGWILEIELSDPGETDDLLDAAAYGSVAS